jgi:hypothetical protein
MTGICQVNKPCRLGKTSEDRSASCSLVHVNCRQFIVPGMHEACPGRCLRGSSISRSPLLPGITYAGSDDFRYMSRSAKQSKRKGKVVTHHLPVVLSLDISQNGFIGLTVTAGPIRQHHM